MPTQQHSPRGANAQNEWVIMRVGVSQSPEKSQHPEVIIRAEVQDRHFHSRFASSHHPEPPGSPPPTSPLHHRASAVVTALLLWGIYFGLDLDPGCAKHKPWPDQLQDLRAQTHIPPRQHARSNPPRQQFGSVPESDKVTPALFSCAAAPPHSNHAASSTSASQQHASR
ncbi:hypothetical protein NQZ68_005717 [Dissostichus eleginoides]|nr:hypothetical protein NQZ68_005717 [Dissostichus eleginoides]